IDQLTTVTWHNHTYLLSLHDALPISSVVERIAPHNTGAAMSCPTNCDLFSWSSRKKIAQGYDTAAAPSRLYARIMDPYVVGVGRPLGSVASQGASQSVLRWRTSYHCLRCT